MSDDLSGNTPSTGQVIRYDGTNVVWGNVSTPTLQSVLDTGNIANQTITLFDTLTKTTSISDSALSISNIISSTDNTEINLSDTLITLNNIASTAGEGSITMQTIPGGTNFITASSVGLPIDGTSGIISISATPTNPVFQLSQSNTVFDETYSLVILKDSIIHDCSGVTGPFTISTNTDLTLTSNQNINLDTPTGQVFINGTAYPPATPSLSSVLTAGPTGNNGQTITLTSSSVVGQTVYGSEQLTQTGAIPYSMNTQGDLLITAPNFNTTNSTIIIPNSGVPNYTFLDGNGAHVITNGASQADLYSGSLEIKDLPTTTESFIAARSSTTLNNFHNQTTNASTPTSVIITDGIVNKTGIFSNNILQLQDNTISGNVGTFGVNSVQGSFNDNDITTSYQLFSQNYAELGIDTNNNTLNKRGSVLLSTNVTNSQYPILDMTNYSSVTPSAYQRVQLSPSKLYSFSNVPAPNIPDFTIQTGGTLKINPGTTLDVVTGTYSTQTSTQINFNSTSGDVNNTGINYNITGTSLFSKLTITNSNSTVGNTAGIASTEYYKSGRNGATGDTIASQRFYAKNYNGDRTEFANMEVNIKNTASSNDDGSIIFRARSNGTMTDFITVNGDENDINMFKPLDMNSNNITTSTGNLTLTTAGVTGASGVITFNSKTQSPTTTADTVFQTNTVNTLTHSDASGWDFYTQKITTSGLISGGTINSIGALTAGSVSTTNGSISTTNGSFTSTNGSFTTQAGSFTTQVGSFSTNGVTISPSSSGTITAGGNITGAKFIGDLSGSVSTSVINTPNARRPLAILNSNSATNPILYNSLLNYYENGIELTAAGNNAPASSLKNSSLTLTDTFGGVFDFDASTTTNKAIRFQSGGNNNLRSSIVGSGTSLELGFDVSNVLVTTPATLSLDASGVSIKTQSAGYTTPQLLLENKNQTVGNTAGVPSFESYKSGRDVIVNDVIYSQSFNANTGGKKTFGKIESIVTGTSGGNARGALDFYATINNTPGLVFRMNGADNENNSFRPLDMNGNNLRTSTGNLTIDTSGPTGATGTGNLTLTTATGATADNGGVITINSRNQLTATTNDMVLQNGGSNTLTHSDVSGWNFQANNITTTGDISCNTLYYTILSPSVSNPSLQSVMDVSYNLQSTAPTTNQVIQFNGTNPVWANADLSGVLTNGNTANNSILLTDGISTNTMNKFGITVSDGIINSAFSGDTVLVQNAQPGTVATTTSLAIAGESETKCRYQDISSDITSLSSIKSQLNQTDYSASVVDNVNGLTGTKTLITIGGAVLDTDTATNGSSTATANRTTTTNSMNQAMTFNSGSISNSTAVNVSPTVADSNVKYLDGSFDIESKATVQSGQATLSTVSKSLNTTEFSSIIDGVLPSAVVTNHTYTSDNTANPSVNSNYSSQINATNALGGFTYNDDPANSNITNSVLSTTTVSTASHTLTSSSASGLNIHSLKMETPVSGDALIAHTVTGASRNLSMTTPGNFLVTSDNFNVGATTTTINHTLLLDDPNTSGSITMNGSNQIAIFTNGNANATVATLALSANSTNVGATENFISSAVPNATIGSKNISIGASSGYISSQMTLNDSSSPSTYHILGEIRHYGGDYDTDPYNVKPELHLSEIATGGAGTYVRDTRYRASGITHTDSGPYTISSNNQFLVDSSNIKITPSSLTLPSTSASAYTEILNGGINFRSSSVSNGNIGSSGVTFNDTNAGSASANLQATKLSITSPLAGYTGQTQIELQNGNTDAGSTTGVPSMDYYKYGRNAIANDLIASQHFYAKNYIGAKTEFAKMEVSVRNTGSGNDDGSISFWGLVNGTTTQFFTLNGQDNENNCFRPLDMNNQAIKSNTGNLTLSTTASTVSGDIILAATDGNTGGNGGKINFTSRKQLTTTTNDMVFQTGTTNTLTHSDASGWKFQANNITTTGDISCNTLYYTSLSPAPSISTGTLQQVLNAGNTASGTTATIGLTNTGVGGLANPQLTLTNSNATANTIPTIEFNKTGRNLTSGETVASISMYGLDAGAQKTEFSKIQVKTENVASGNEDGTLSIFTAVNGVNSEVFNFNGGQNENNSFRPLDMNGNNIRTTVENLTIDATGSTGTGNLNLNAKQHIQLVPGTAGDIIGLTSNGNISMTANGLAGGTAGFISLTADRFVGLASAQGGSDGDIIFDTNGIGAIYFSGANLQSPTSGGNSGQHLRIKLNGTFYKIRLEID